MTRSLPFYRTPVTRWTMVATGLVLAAMLSPWSPDSWRATPSLRWLHHGLPWTVLFVLLVGYVLLIASGRTGGMVAGCGLGLVLYSWELVALCATLHLNRPTNPFLFAGCSLACSLHYAALRLAIHQEARRDR